MQFQNTTNQLILKYVNYHELLIMMTIQLLLFDRVWRARASKITMVNYFSLGTNCTA